MKTKLRTITNEIRDSCSSIEKYNEALLFFWYFSSDSWVHNNISSNLISIGFGSPNWGLKTARASELRYFVVMNKNYFPVADVTTIRHMSLNLKSLYSSKESCRFFLNSRINRQRNNVKVNNFCMQSISFMIMSINCFNSYDRNCKTKIATTPNTRSYFYFAGWPYMQSYVIYVCYIQLVCDANMLSDMSYRVRLMNEKER